LYRFVARSTFFTDYCAIRTELLRFFKLRPVATLAQLPYQSQNASPELRSFV